MTSPFIRKILPLCFTLGVLGYLLPWAQHPSSGLSLNAYDLASWSVRHAEEFRGLLVMLTSFLLRVQLPILAALLVGVIGKRGWLFTLPIIIALLPPPDGLIQDPGNPSYRQLLALALVTMIIAAVGARIRDQRRMYWTLLWSLIGIASSTFAAIRVIELYGSLKLDVRLGPSLALFVLAYMLLVITALFQWLQRYIQSSEAAILSVT